MPVSGDSTVAALKRAPGACLNLVQCSGSMHWVAMNLEQEYGTPYIDVNFFGAENTAESLRRIARFYGDEEIVRRTEALIERETKRVRPVIERYREKLKGKRAAIYVGGAFKALAIIRQLQELGKDVIFTGTQTGMPAAYEVMGSLEREGSSAHPPDDPRQRTNNPGLRTL